MLITTTMSSILVIDPKKLRLARGHRTQGEIVAAARHKFSEQQLSGWETGKYHPRPKNIPPLLEALGVTFDDVASPIGAENFLTVP